jgi:hypothetical protein
MKTDDDGSAAAPTQPKSGRIGYKVLASIGAAISATVARKALTTGWRKITGREPPVDPENPDTRWTEAAGWAVASAAAVAAARIFAQRRVAATWRRASGELPPGVGDLPE